MKTNILPIKQLIEAAIAMRGSPDKDSSHVKLYKALEEIERMGREQEQHADAIQRARDQYASDDVDFDDNPMVSVGEDGVWVSAWVWVPKPDAASDEESAD